MAIWFRFAILKFGHYRSMLSEAQLRMTLPFLESNGAYSEYAGLAVRRPRDLLSYSNG
jgi:hypothetical protein